MSLFKRRFGRDRKSNKDKRSEPAVEPARKAPTLDVAAGDMRHGEIKAKVQGEVSAILARTVLELIQSSHARIPSMDEPVRRQSINRLYADILYDFLASGEKPGFDPAELVLGWAREAMAGWGADQKRLDEGIASDKAALSESILAALEAAAHDQTLRKAAEQRVRAASRAPAADGPAAG